MINLDKVDFPQRILSDVENVFNKFEDITKVVIFGSRARKDNKLYSDIDLAIYGLKKENEIKFWDLMEEIDTLYSFDLVFISEDISDTLLSQIKRHGVVIYER